MSTFAQIPSTKRNEGSSRHHWLNPQITRFLLTAFFILCAQIFVSYRLRGFLYFNDDLEPIAAGKFFHSLYIRQFSVHLPIHPMLAYFWDAIAGFTPLSNRLMAGTMDAVIEALILAIGYRLGGYWTGFTAALLYLCFEVHLWAFLNLSELPSILFALCAMCFGMRFSKPTLEVEINRPFWLGFFLSLSLLARFMAIPLIACILLLTLPGLRRLWNIRQMLSLSLLGALIPIALIAIYFMKAGSLGALLHWALAYNFSARSNPKIQAWIGDLSTPEIRDMWIFILATLLLSVVSFFLVWRRRDSANLRALAICFLPAAGAWMGANPSGIGQVAFHAIPAFPFLCLLFVNAISILLESPVLSGRSRVVWRTTLVGSGLLLTFPFISRTIKMTVQAPKTADYDHAAQIGSYIEKQTKPSDSIFIFGTNPFIYVTSRRESATEFSIVYGDLVKFQDQLLSELKRARPAAIVFDKSDFWFSRNLSGFPKIVTWIVQNYRVSRRFDDVLLRPSAEASADVFLDPDSLAQLDPTSRSALHAKEHWKDVQNLIPVEIPHPLAFSSAGEWQQFYVPAKVNFEKLGPLRNLTLEVTIKVEGVPGSFKKYPLRVLFAGHDGEVLHQFTWAWIPVTESRKPVTVHAPLSWFTQRQGDFAWSDVKGIQLGGWGPARSKLTIYSADVLAPGN